MMGLLADRILADKEVSGVEKELIQRAQRVRADNVAELYFANPDEWAPRDFPNLVPPWPLCWIECSGHNSGAVRQWGAIIADNPKIIPDGSPDGWHAFSLILYIADRRVSPKRVVDMHFVVDESGRVIPGLSKANALPIDDLTGDEVFGAMHGYLSSLLLAISFMHCKNVGHVPASISKFANSESWRKHHRPLLTYKTLVIDHLKKTLRTEGGMESGNSLKRALHICRGHFSHYSEEKPLFGKKSGTFWIPQHVRGSAENGVVAKDYVVA